MSTGKIERMPESNKFSDFLAEQMKDPEFAAAYRAVSTEEDRRLVEIQRLEREVISAAKEWKRDWTGNTKRLHAAINALEAFEADHK